MNLPFSIAITSNEISLLSRAQQLAQKNSLPYIDYLESSNFDYVLILSSTGLYLDDTQKN